MNREMTLDGGAPLCWTPATNTRPRRKTPARGRDILRTDVGRGPRRQPAPSGAAGAQPRNDRADAPIDCSVAEIEQGLQPPRWRRIADTVMAVVAVFRAG